MRLTLFKLCVGFPFFFFVFFFNLMSSSWFVENFICATSFKLVFLSFKGIKKKHLKIKFVLKSYIWNSKQWKEATNPHCFFVCLIIFVVCLLIYIELCLSLQGKRKAKLFRSNELRFNYLWDVNVLKWNLTSLAFTALLFVWNA